MDGVREYLESLHIFTEIHETRVGGVVSSHCGLRTLDIVYCKHASLDLKIKKGICFLADTLSVG